MRTTRPDQTTFTMTLSDRPDTTSFGRYLATRRNYTETAISLREALRQMTVETETLADVLRWMRANDVPRTWDAAVHEAAKQMRVVMRRREVKRRYLAETAR